MHTNLDVNEHLVKANPWPFAHLRLSVSLAFTRYCHPQYCMVYGIQQGGRWEGVYCAMVVQ